MDALTWLTSPVARLSVPYVTSLVWSNARQPFGTEAGMCPWVMRSSRSARRAWACHQSSVTRSKVSSSSSGMIWMARMLLTKLFSVAALRVGLSSGSGFTAAMPSGALPLPSPPTRPQPARRRVYRASRRSCRHQFFACTTRQRNNLTGERRSLPVELLKAHRTNSDVSMP